MAGELSNGKVAPAVLSGPSPSFTHVGRFQTVEEWYRPKCDQSESHTRILRYSLKLRFLFDSSSI